MNILLTCCHFRSFEGGHLAKPPNAKGQVVISCFVGLHKTSWAILRLELLFTFQKSRSLSKNIAVRVGKYRVELKFQNAMAKLLIMAVLVILGMMATVTDAQATCAQKLVSCYPYLNNATAQPQDDCCNPIREAVTNDLPCLCNLYNDPNVFASLKINVSEALRISRECGVTNDLRACNATSPTAPPGQSGRDNGGADRIALTGITTLFLFLVSIALY
ncbi:hypothetical protein CRYUN_Cryun07bG0166600 [Craigia yunnanensis]